MSKPFVKKSKSTVITGTLGIDEDKNITVTSEDGTEAALSDLVSDLDGEFLKINFAVSSEEL